MQELGEGAPPIPMGRARRKVVETPLKAQALLDTFLVSFSSLTVFPSRFCIWAHRGWGRDKEGDLEDMPFITGIQVFMHASKC